MECANCRKDPNLIILVPTKVGSGFMCLTCSIQLGLYCERHRTPHTGFVDHTHACLRCVDEQVPAHEAIAAEALASLRQVLLADELEELEDWLDIVTTITQLPEDLCFARAVLAKALRSGSTFEGVIDAIRQTKSFAEVMPLSPF